MGLRVVHNPPPAEDFTLDRLVAMTNATCVVALDKTLDAIFYTPSYAYAATRASGYCERLCRASHEVGKCLPNPPTKGE